MVRSLNLVLDENPPIGRGIFAEQVGAEWPNVLLLPFEAQLAPDRLTEQGKVFRLG